MSDFDINNYTDKLQRKINRAVNRLVRNETPSDNVLDNLMKEMEEEGNPVEDLSRLNLILNGMKNYKLETNRIFNVDNGFVKNFAFDRRPINELVSYQSNVTRMKEDVVKVINESKSIQVNQASLENKNQILQELEESKDINKISRYTEKVVGEEELKALNKLIKALESISLDNLSVRQLPTFESLKRLAGTFDQLDYIPASTRNDFYGYWEDISKEFDRLASYFKPVSAQLTGIEVEELPESMVNLTLPNYIIKVSAVEVTTKSDEDLIGEVVSKFLQSVNKEIPKKYKYLFTDLSEDAPVKVYGGDAAREADYDPTEQEKDIEEREQIIERLKRTSQTVQVDPLHAIMVTKGILDGEYSDTIINTAREEIKEITSLGDLGIFAEEIEGLINNEIDKYLDKLSKSEVIRKGEGGMYTMPIIDNPEVVNLLKNNAARYQVEYVERGEIKTKSYTDYEEVIKFVNEKSVKFFCGLSELLEIKTGTTGLLDAPRRVAQHGKKGGGSSLPYLGGITRRTIPKIAEIDVERKLKFSSIIQVIEDYYNKPLTNPEMLFEDDRPSFYFDKCFKDFPEILESSATMLARKAIKMDAKPILEPIDYKNIKRLINIIRRDQDVEYGPTLTRLFESASESYVNLWSGVSIASKEGTKPIRNLTTKVDTVLGDVLYEIAKESLSENEIEGEVFADRPLKYWKEQQDDNNYQLDNPLILLESPEWKDTVETSTVRGMKSNYMELISTLKQGSPKLSGPITDALLQATDIIRKMSNKKTFYSNLDYGDIDDISYVIDVVHRNYNVDIYGIDIYNILKSQSSFNDISDKFGLSKDIVYTIKALFR